MAGEPEFEWDEGKSQECLEGRGFDFGFASRLWEQRVNEREDNRRDYGEVRIQAPGVIEDQYFVVVFTWRGTSRRIISARRAQEKEVRKWQK
jgi:uncharacterized DUF497 family protein